MLGMTQTALGKAFGLTFQQVQKYERGMNRMGASRLQQAADVLGVSVPFFFEDVPGKESATTPLPSYIDDFVSSSDGLRLIRAFMQIDSSGMRRSIVGLVQELAEPE
jgi:transcriptional regulator with XRE-family HTH domain